MGFIYSSRCLFFFVFVNFVVIILFNVLIFSAIVTKTGDGGDKNVEITVDDSLRQKHDLMFVNVHLVLKAITQIVPM